MDSSLIISLVSTSIGTFAGILASNKLTNYRIEQLEKKVDKHNSVIDRTYRLEQEVAILKGGKIKEKWNERNNDRTIK